MNEEIIKERDEALSFARSEAKRNAELQSSFERYENREKRDYDAYVRIRDILKSVGFGGGSYMGMTDPITRERFADDKRTPPFELIEEVIKHLQMRARPQ